MGIEECIARAVVSNQEILVASFEPLKSDGEIMQAKGEFDPNVGATATFFPFRKHRVFPDLLIPGFGKQQQQRPGQLGRLGKSFESVGREQWKREQYPVDPDAVGHEPARRQPVGPDPRHERRRHGDRAGPAAV